MDELIDLERQKWDAFRRKDTNLLGGLYDAQAISIGYGADGSVGARSSEELLSGLDDLDLREVSLEDFKVLPVGNDGAVVTYRSSFKTGRGFETTVMASSVWKRDASGWKTMFFQATAAPLQ